MSRPARSLPRWPVLTLLLCLLAATAGSTASLKSEAESISADRYMAHVRYLASDELEGRGNGTEGLEKAAGYIERLFREYGLGPGGSAGSFLQPFEIVTGLRVEGDNRLELLAGTERISLELGTGYYPVSVATDEAGGPDASAGALPLVFAGYGIDADSIGYDDYAGVDVAGKAVLAFTHEPQEEREDSRFDGKAFTQHAGVMNKAMVARAKGAALLVLVEDPSHEQDIGNFDGFLRDPQAEAYGLPVVRVKRDAMQDVLGARLDLAAVHAAIDETLSPRSEALQVSIVLDEDYSKVRREVRNVIGVLPGADPTVSAEAIVIGAHYDHLGLGGRHSLAPAAAGQIHNGADDNASGTAALLEMARVASQHGEFPRTLVFVAFAGEELGLLGSSHYVSEPTVPLERTAAMINLDMVGRPRGRILVSGLETAPALETELDAVRRELSEADLEIRSFAQGAGVGASDDTSFLVRKVPSIGFFSGFHGDYHRPTDDWDRLDPEGGVRVARLAYGLAKRLAALEQAPAFVERLADPHSSGVSAGNVGGYGPYFGSVPDFAEDGNGVKFAEVRPGSPAAQAGLQGGDVLVEFDGTPIETLYDFTFALRNKRPGDEVEVVVLRAGQAVRAKVELGRRP